MDDKPRIDGYAAVSEKSPCKSEARAKGRMRWLDLQAGAPTPITGQRQWHCSKVRGGGGRGMLQTILRNFLFHVFSLSSSVQEHSCKKQIALTHRNAQSQTALLVGEILLLCGGGEEMSLMDTLMATPAPEIQPGTQNPGISLQTWHLSSRDTSLSVGTSYLLICPGSPDRNQLLETLWILVFELTDLCGESPLLFHPSRGVRSPCQLGLWTWGFCSPGAVFEGRGCPAAADGSQEVGGGEERGPAESRVAPWDCKFLLCLFIQIDPHFYFEMHVFPWLK